MDIQIGRRLYFNSVTGLIVCDTGEREGFTVVPLSIEEEITIFNIPVEELKVVQLAYGEDLQAALIAHNIIFPAVEEKVYGEDLIVS